MAAFFDKARRRLSVLTMLLVALPELFTFHAYAEEVAPLAKIDQRRVAVSSVGEDYLSHLDERGQLHLLSALNLDLDMKDICDLQGVVTRRKLLLVKPRVEEIQCVVGGNEYLLLLGFDELGKERWRRKLEFLSGQHRIKEVVIGSDASALILSDLEVLAPEDGKVLFSAPVHLVEGNRSTPNYQFNRRAVFVASEQKFIIFDADVTLVRRRGGLFRLDPKKGVKELVLPALTTPLGGLWGVQDMALDMGGRHLFLALRRDGRAGGGTALVLFDLAEKRILYRDNFSNGDSPRLTLGLGGLVFFTYIDRKSQEIVAVHYRATRIAGSP